MNYSSRSKTSMFSIFFVLIIIGVILSIAYQAFVYFQTKSIIEKYECIPTTQVTQEFSSNGDGVDSVTKVFYKCKDHGRWLRSYDLF